ncbi:hypothetical protein K2X33_02905 [bacterium]|nr:hypothetical protein [bacterium]
MAVRGSILGLLLILTVGSPAFGKNLGGRVGFGMNFLNFSQAAALSLKYFHDPTISSNFLFGFNTQKDEFIIGGRLARNVIMEENMNLFLAVAGMFETQRGTTMDMGVEFQGLLGAEFFLAGLPNLAFQFDVGVSLRTIGGTGFRSIGGGFAGGAIHYYF